MRMINVAVGITYTNSQVKLCFLKLRNLVSLVVPNY